MKSKIDKTLLFVVIGIVFLIVGVITIVSKTTSSADDEEQKEVKDEPKELRKILEEEINDETAKEIVQFYLDKDFSNENKKIINATVLASNEKGKYLIRLEIENNNNDKMDTSIQYLGEGKWKVELPLKYSGDISDEYTEFWGVEEE